MGSRGNVLAVNRPILVDFRYWPSELAKSCMLSLQGLYLVLVPNHPCIRN